MLKEQVLEARRQVDLGGLDRREAVEQLVGEGRCAVLNRAGEAIGPRHFAELTENLEIELDLGHAAVGQRNAAV